MIQRFEAMSFTESTPQSPHVVVPTIPKRKTMNRERTCSMDSLNDNPPPLPCPKRLCRSRKQYAQHEELCFSDDENENEHRSRFDDKDFIDIDDDENIDYKPCWWSQITIGNGASGSCFYWLNQMSIIRENSDEPMEGTRSSETTKKASNLDCRRRLRRRRQMLLKQAKKQIDYGKQTIGRCWKPNPVH